MGANALTVANEVFAKSVVLDNIMTLSKNDLNQDKWKNYYLQEELDS